MHVFIESMFGVVFFALLVLMYFIIREEIRDFKRSRVRKPTINDQFFDQIEDFRNDFA